MRNPLKGNIVTDIPHLLFKEPAVKQSISKMVRVSAPIPDFHGGYSRKHSSMDPILVLPRSSCSCFDRASCWQCLFVPL
jgi:hypothetical protein